MPASFLDTTVLIDLSDSRQSARISSEQFVRLNQPSEVAEYALRELLTGVVRYYCDAHNILIASQNVPEAIVAVLQRFFMGPRRSAAVIRVLAASLSNIFGTGAAVSGDDSKREALQAIKMKAASLWNRANNLKNVTRVHPLACFNGGDIAIGGGGLLRGPNDRFDCLVRQRCAAAGYIHDDLPAVRTLIAALHPNNLTDKAQTKTEHAQRRKALKELEKRGPKDFPKGRCRALGDAYFAVMCPAGATIGTTNLDDFEPLCRALRKRFMKP
jgi:hypothetical protein